MNVGTAPRYIRGSGTAGTWYLPIVRSFAIKETNLRLSKRAGTILYWIHGTDIEAKRWDLEGRKEERLLLGASVDEQFA